jgi:aminopeptidase N
MDVMKNTFSLRVSGVVFGGHLCMRIPLSSLLLILIFLVSTGQSAQIVHQEIEAKIEPAQHSITVTDVVTVTIKQGEGKPEPFGFFLNRNLELTVVSAVDTGLPFTLQEIPSQSTEYAQAKFYEVFPPEVGWGTETLRLRFVYHGILFDPLQPPDPTYGRGFAQTTGLITSQGIYLAGSTFWVPSRPGELFSFTLRTILPEGYASVSQGKRVTNKVVEGMVHTEWHCPFPQEEIYLIAGKYVVTEEKYRDVDIMMFLDPVHSHLGDTYISATKSYLDLYNHLIGPYPYQKFALVEKNYWQTGFGMPSFTLLGSEVIQRQFIMDISYGHEILHNWWGNSVYVDREKGNWSEGLTVYGADYLYKERQSPEASREYRMGILGDYLNFVHRGKDFPLTNFRERHSWVSQTIGYGKAALVFHMLRNMVGEENFWASLRQFYQDFRFKVASWDDIFSSFTAVTKRDLRVFQTQWIEQAGAPFLTLDTVTLQQSHPPYVLEVVISQAPPYVLDVPVRIHTEQGEIMRSAPLKEPVHRLQFTLDAKPLSVHLDPDFDVFRKLHRAEIPPTLSQAMGAESVLIVVPSQGDPEMVQAYEALATYWEKKENHTVVKDVEYTPTLARDKTVWLFGKPDIQMIKEQKLPEGVSITPDQWMIAGTAYDPTQHSLVLTVSHPENPDLTINRFIAQNPQMVLIIGQKLVHYGKYSFLVFAAEKNVGKGIWPVTTSPMVKMITAE